MKAKRKKQGLGARPKKPLAAKRRAKRSKPAAKAPRAVKAAKRRQPGVMSRQALAAFNNGYDTGFNQGFAQGMQDGQSFLAQ
jgi:flagellar biosynthesis/type III secretory pathway protein FliH